MKRKVRYKYLVIGFALILIGFLIRGLFFEKEVSFVIANETEYKVPDLVIKIDNETVFNDSIFLSSIPCCWTSKTIGYGLHNICIESRSDELYKEFKIFSFKNTHIYIGVWDNGEGELWIEKRVHYFISAIYS
jgi:hypothetical protein